VKGEKARGRKIQKLLKGIRYAVGESGFGTSKPF
jgi:hypothetical protein